MKILHLELEGLDLFFNMVCDDETLLSLMTLFDIVLHCTMFELSDTGKDDLRYALDKVTELYQD